MARMDRMTVPPSLGGSAEERTLEYGTTEPKRVCRREDR